MSATRLGHDATQAIRHAGARLVPATVDPDGWDLDALAATLRQSSSRLAYLVHEKLIGASGALDRGVQQAPFYVLMGLDAPAVLIEVGFISHPDEAQRLADGEYQAKLAQAIADGVQAFLLQINARDGKTP